MVLDDLDPMLEIDLTKQIFSYFRMEYSIKSAYGDENSLLFWSMHILLAVSVYLEDGGGWAPM